jgi:phosphohistidine phosphatase
MSPEHRPEKVLLLLHHAKARWDQGTITDHDLPLTPKGKKNARQVGRFLAQTRCIPEIILSSTAQRALETASLLAQQCNFSGNINKTPLLYHASPKVILEALIEIPDHFSRVMIVGHNPGLRMLLETLTRQWHPLPTAGLAHVTLSISRWQDLDGDRGNASVEIHLPPHTQAFTPLWAPNAAI